MTFERDLALAGVEQQAQRLPRGRHGIPPELVTANQRERLLTAATAIFAERGYSAVSVAGIIERAAVSRQTFYELFENKGDCLLAAQRRAFNLLEAVIDAACAAQQRWPDGVAAAVPAVLRFAEDFPDEARLILASSTPSAEPGLLKGGLSVNEWLIGLLHEGSRRHPEARTPTDLTEQAAVGAAVSIVGSCLTNRRIGPLPGLRHALVRIILAPYVGGDEALKVAETAG